MKTKKKTDKMMMNGQDNKKSQLKNKLSGRYTLFS